MYVLCVTLQHHHHLLRGDTCLPHPSPLENLEERRKEIVVIKNYVKTLCQRNQEERRKEDYINCINIMLEGFIYAPGRLCLKEGAV